MIGNLLRLIGRQLPIVGLEHLKFLMKFLMKFLKVAGKKLTQPTKFWAC